MHDFKSGARISGIGCHSQPQLCSIWSSDAFPFATRIQVTVYYRRLDDVVLSIAVKECVGVAHKHADTILSLFG